MLKMIKWISGLIIIFILFCSCIKSNKKLRGNITRIKVTYVSPDRVIENKGVSFISEFYISYWGKYTIYELPYHITNEIDNVLIYDSTKYEFFICKKNKTTGYLLKNLNDSFAKKIAGDSIIATRAMAGGDGNQFGFTDIEIKSINKLSDVEPVTYRYLFDSAFYDSAYLSYKNELKNIEFSLSKTLDSTYNSKLCKIQLFIKHDTLGILPNLKDFYINSFEISDAPSKNEQALKDLFERFIQDEKNLLLKE
jgi:hypothetical protein